MNASRIKYLLDQYAIQQCTREEMNELKQLLPQNEEDTLFINELDKWISDREVNHTLSPEKASTILQTVLQSSDTKTQKKISPVVQMNFMHQKWWGWAAAILLLLTTGTYLWMQNGEKHQQHTLFSQQIPLKDIPAGKSGAILTLSDGTQLVLDSLRNGTIALQNGTQVILKNGQLAYDPTSKNNGSITYNTMSTPKGRQFQVTLPDGSQVWLNSASSITYPTSFIGNERRINIEGEAYFEVAKNPKMPFRIKINNRAEVEVLGTHFNINAYRDEDNIKTTLLEGQVKVTAGSENALLQPGQQAQLKATEKILIINADIEKVMAWKNGFFNFDGVRMDEVMRQLSRWYDIEVVYEKGVPSIVFAGEMDRTVSLNGLLKGLEGFGVHFRVEGRRLIVLP